MKKYLLSFLSLGGLSLLVWAFAVSSCGSKSYDLVFKNIELSTYADDLILENGGPATKDNLVIKAAFYPHVILAQKTPSIITQANAMLYIKPDQYNYIEHISSIKMVTLHDYNAQYPAGSDATSLFKYHFGNGQTTEVARLVDYLNSLQNTTRNDFKGIYRFTMSLKEAPANPGNTQAFVMELRTDKNGLLKDTTVNFTLN